MFDAKYKKVKFFGSFPVSLMFYTIELVKSERKLKKARKQLANAPDEKKAELQAEVHKYEDYILYTKYFPSNEKYLSLYAKDCEMHEEKRKAILAKIKEKTKERQEKVKAELKDENNGEAEGVEENAEDDFFETEGAVPAASESAGKGKMVPKKEGEVAMKPAKPANTKKMVRFVLRLWSNQVILPKKRPNQEEDAGNEAPQKISLVFMTVGQRNAQKSQFSKAVPAPPKESIPQPKPKVKKIEVPEKAETDNDKPQAISFVRFAQY